jgi:hypothetical protein
VSLFKQNASVAGQSYQYELTELLALVPRKASPSEEELGPCSSQAANSLTGINDDVRMAQLSGYHEQAAQVCLMHATCAAS